MGTQSTWGLLSLFRGDNHHVPSSVYPVCLHPLFHPHQLSELFPHQPWGWWFLHLHNPWPWWCQPPSGSIPPSSKNPTICPPSDLLLPCSSPTSLPCPSSGSLPCSSPCLPCSSYCSWPSHQLW